MNSLFQASSIKSLNLANRSVRSATWSGVGDDKGYLTDRAIELYSELAAGGVGLVVTGFQYVLPNGVAMIYQVGNYDESQVAGLSRLARAIHEAGSKVVVQLVHAGARANPKFFAEPAELWAPSTYTDEYTGNTAREMTVTEIAQTVEAYAAAASRCKRAGIDGVQFHGAHGYGINQFLAAATNRRGDAYGGEISSRYRYLGEVLEAVRGAVGDDYPVLIKLSGKDFVEGGLSTEESLYVARRLEEDRLDAIEVSGGNRAAPNGMTPSRLKIRKPEDEAYLLEIAARFKGTVKLPVITVGGFRSPEIVDAALSQGKADYVAMCRPFIREPGLVNRWKSGDLKKATCISCNGCFEAGTEGNGVYCKIEKKLKADAQAEE